MRFFNGLCRWALGLLILIKRCFIWCSKPNDRPQLPKYPELSDGLWAYLGEIVKQYDQFDPGHDRRHVLAVAARARALALTHAPELTCEAIVAAVFHDSALDSGREKHAVIAAQRLLNSAELGKRFGVRSRLVMADAVKNHRASTGQPTTMLARILVDADRVPISAGHAFMRAYAHGRQYHPWLTHHEQLRRAAYHLYDKYGPNGYGRNEQFPETTELIDQILSPLFRAFERRDYEYPERLLWDEMSPPGSVVAYHTGCASLGLLVLALLHWLCVAAATDLAFLAHDVSLPLLLAAIAMLTIAWPRWLDHVKELIAMWRWAANGPAKRILLMAKSRNWMCIGSQ